ncbi:hypothetical protein E6R61_04920 [Streptomyces sp. LRa12]|uniref:hypothetical protein n=1 Tax=Streptomyces sp. LRa12 TaxID=2563107 RepID=UPI00109ECD16|nr:hypothetical protein [Streptomyces sp. LRa12]THA98979.1 hypothetical protein E6R61_04920 [Streptomyces sp. LRa12]
MMPAMLPATHKDRLSAPLSRRDDAVVVLSPCWACGASGGLDWINVDGIGVLVHGRERCPVAVPFVWETGQPIAAQAEAVAA